MTGDSRSGALSGTAKLLRIGTAAAILLAAACSRAPQPPSPDDPRSFLVFPPPPQSARVQYLGAVSSRQDFPQKRGWFAEFLLGPPEERSRLAKPVAALLSGNRLYVCDTVLDTVAVFDMLSGEVHRLAGDSGIGKIRQPNNLAVDQEGRLYVADKQRAAVLVYGPDERFLHAWGRPLEAAPVAVAVGRTVLYVADIKDHEIEVWDARTGEFLRSFGGKGNAPGQFIFPSHLALDAHENLYVTDTGNRRVQKFSPDGKFLRQFGRPGTALGSFVWPKGLAVDGRGRLYVADSRFANTQIFDEEGRLLLFFGGPGPDNGNLDLPAGVSVHPWPSIPWLTERLAPGFDPEFLVIVVNQWQNHFINFFAVAREQEPTP